MCVCHLLLVVVLCRCDVHFLRVMLELRRQCGCWNHFFLLHPVQIVWYSYCHVDSFVVVTCILFLVVSCVDTLVLAGKSSANDFVSLRLFHAVSILTRSVIRPISTVITVVAGCRYYWLRIIPYHDDPIGIQCQCCLLFWSRAHALWLVGFS